MGGERGTHTEQLPNTVIAVSSEIVAAKAMSGEVVAAETEDCLKKVKKHPMFVNNEPASQKAIAEDLVNPGKVKARFEHLLAVEEYMQNIEEADQCEVTWSMEKDKRRDQQKMETAKAWSLPVKLFLSKLQQDIPTVAKPFTTLLRLEYGPLHAGLVVGDICIDWNTSGLVVPLPAPDMAGDFQAHVDGDRSLEEHAGKHVKDMSLANRRNLDIPHKLDIIYKSREEKEKLINNLVDVIVKYNKTKKYSLFFCNCQHFVKDAMSALHIRNTPQFGGNLGEYLEGLKQGKLAGLQFNSHIELDIHVKDKLKNNALDVREKEYLLCVYFQFHSIEIEDLDPDQQDKWKCPIATCQCSELEYQIDNRVLYLNNFRQQQASLASQAPPPKHISAIPRIASVQEEEEDDLNDVTEGGAGPSTLVVNKVS